MTQPEIRDLFDRLRDVPQPPLTPSAQMLAGVRRSTRRRRARLLAGTAMAVLLAGFGATVAVRQVAGPARVVAAPPPPPASAGRAAPAVPVQAMPSAQAVLSHAPLLTRLMTAAVPAGYTVHPTSFPAGAAATSRQVDIHDGSFRTVTLLRVGRAGGTGMLGVVFGDDMAAPGPNPCAADRDLGIEGAKVEGCTMVSVAGTAIRVVTGHDAGLGRVISATRFLRGGYLVVSFSQSVRAYWVVLSSSGPHGAAQWRVAINPAHEPTLSTMPFSSTQLAALAGDPAALPAS